MKSHKMILVIEAGLYRKSMKPGRLTYGAQYVSSMYTIDTEELGVPSGLTDKGARVLAAI